MITVTTVVKNLSLTISQGGAVVMDEVYGIGWATDSVNPPSRKAVYDKIESLVLEGTGDMLKSVYDTNDNGKVDSAQNSDTVNGLTVETAVPSGAVFTDTVYDDTAILSTLSDKQDILAEGAFVDGDKTKLDGIEVGATADQSDAEIKTAYENNANTNAFTDAEKTKLGLVNENAEVNPDVVPQAEAEAGIATTERIWTAERVKQAIEALAPTGGSVDDTAYAISWDGVTSVAPSKNALYDFIESQVFKVSTLSHLVPIFWYGTEAQKAIDFPSGVPANYFTITSDGATTAIEGTDLASTAVTSGWVLQADGDGTCSWVALSSGGDALTTNPLSQFASTTLAQLNGVISDATLGDSSDFATAAQGSLADSALQSADIADFETTTELNARDTANRSRANHTGTQTASTISDFDTEVSNNASVVANTAKVTYPSADSTKVGFISVTQAVDLDTMKSNITTNNAKVGVTTEISNLSEDTTPQLGGELDLNGHSVGGDAQTATGDGTTTIDWGAGNFFHFQFGAFNEVFTFTAPSKAGTFILKLVQDSVGSRTATFPATVKWSGGTAPTLTTTATTGTDIITFYFDGTNYFGVEVLNFS